MRDKLDATLSDTVAAIKSAVDADSIIGKPIAAGDGNVVIPISKVSYGFITGSGEYGADKKHSEDEYPFAIGSGAGVTVKPIGFLVTGKTNTFIKVEGEEEDKWLNLGKNILKLLK